MKVDEWTSEDVHTSGGGEFPPCAGLTSNALPEAQSTVSAESSQTGVSTRSVHILSKSKVQKEEEIPHWYALRTTYGREKKAYDYMTAKGITAFYPTTDTVKLIKGKRKVVTESRLPNIFFAYGTEEQLKTFVYDNVNLPFLRFYYRHVHVGRRIEKIPMIVPDYQMDSLKIISRSAKVQARTDGESNRRSIQRSGRQSCKMARTTESGCCAGRTGNGGDSVCAECVFRENHLRWVTQIAKNS